MKRMYLVTLFLSMSLMTLFSQEADVVKSSYPLWDGKTELSLQDVESFLFELDGDVMSFENHDYLLYSPLLLVNGDNNFKKMYNDMLPVVESDGGLFWGDRGTGYSRCSWGCNWEIKHNKLYLTKINHIPISSNFLEFTKKIGLKEFSKERMYARMEEFIGCTFSNGKMFCSTLSGILYIKKCNTAKRPDGRDFTPEEKEILNAWKMEPVTRIVLQNGVVTSVEQLQVK